MEDWIPIVSPNSLQQYALGFWARGILVNNLSNQWYMEPLMRRWIPPYTLGVSGPLRGTQTLTLLNQAPSGLVQLAPNAAEEIDVMVYDVERDVSAGVPAIGYGTITPLSGVSTQLGPAANMWTDTGLIVPQGHQIVGVSLSVDVSTPILAAIGDAASQIGGPIIYTRLAASQPSPWYVAPDSTRGIALAAGDTHVWIFVLVAGVTAFVSVWMT